MFTSIVRKRTCTTMVFTTEEKNEQCAETPENLRLIALAKDRVNNRRVGDRALQQLIEQQRSNIRSAIRKRRINQPFLDAEELEFAAIEGIIKRLDRYDPSRGCKFSSWAYFGIFNGIEQVARNAKKNYKAKLEAQYNLPAYTDEEHQDSEFLEKIQEQIAVLPEAVQEVIYLVMEGWPYTEIGKMLGK